MYAELLRCPKFFANYYWTIVNKKNNGRKTEQDVKGESVGNFLKVRNRLINTR